MKNYKIKSTGYFQGLLLIISFMFMTQNKISAQGDVPTPYFSDTYFIGNINNAPEGVTVTSQVFFDTAQVDNRFKKLDYVKGNIFTVYAPPHIFDYTTNASLYRNENESNFDISNTFLTESYNYENPPIKYVRGVAFAKLRINSGVNDLLVLRDDTLIVFKNDYDGSTIKERLFRISGITGNFVTKGIVDRTDNYQDAIYADLSGNIKIFKSNGNGTLDPNVITAVGSLGSVKKIISVQIDNLIEPYLQILVPNSRSNREDLIFSVQNKVYVYKNNNNNTFSQIRTFNYGSDIVRDFEMADLNNDGYNDLMVAVERFDQSYNYIKIYLNNGAGNINQTESYSNMSNHVLRGTALSTGDFNKDGYLDMVLGRDSAVSVFLNTGQPGLFGQTTFYKYIFLGYEFITRIYGKKLITADLHNYGGLSVLYVGSEGPLTQFPFFDKPYRINPAVIDVQPSPPFIFKQVHSTGVYLRPLIRLFPRGEKDFSKFYLYKKSPNTNNIWTKIAEITSGSSYIDHTEYIVTSPGDPVNYQNNCFYRAVSVDQSSHLSMNSSEIGYKVGHPYADDEELGPDQSVSDTDQEIEGLTNPEEYFVTNFPNPFNPGTKIYYNIPLEGEVKITIYNSAGQLINILINEFKAKGNYVLDFDGSNLSSGLYYYRLESNRFVATKKMLLLK